MSTSVIQVENLGKRYVLGAGSGDTSSRYRTLRESVMSAAEAPLRWLRGRNEDARTAASTREFWALRDVTFEINSGEVVGIIGRNGAGKSTLLKVLSRITEPTRGRITIRGRVASLLEVGTGFHPELTGRENIYLNGAILGMQRAEIKAKFDEIVAFAEVERFLDTPVKRYSSGMYVRLAFAVAAHLEPEILVVDEVLAVGDTEFQKKCLGKMKSVSTSEGRTVLFVSHNLGAVTQLCTKAIFLESGHLVSQGEVPTVIGRYLDQGAGQWTEKTWSPETGRPPGDDRAQLLGVRAINAKAELIQGNIDVREAVGIEVRYRVLREGTILTPTLHLHNSEGVQILLTIDLEQEWLVAPRPCGEYQSTAWIPPNFLNIGMHYVSVGLSRMDLVTVHVFERDAIAFHVDEGGGTDTARGIYSRPLPGAIRPILDWKTVRLNGQA